MSLDKDYYNMIFKRKSFRRFNDKLKLSKEELMDIENKIITLVPLEDNIEIKYKIVPRSETTCKRGEYSLLLYSEEKENYLLNLGYIFEQLDLYLASKDIGVCWYGMGKTQEAMHGNLNFVIMLALGKVEASEFRKDYRKAKRKETNEIWTGPSNLMHIAEVVKYAPSACNTQPWRIKVEKDIVKIYRNTRIKSIMPKEKVPFYNSIDMGIFLCFLELAFQHNSISFKKHLCTGEEKDGLIQVAEYEIYNLK